MVKILLGKWKIISAMTGVAYNQKKEKNVLDTK
jgi:hypothetical protein